MLKGVLVYAHSYDDVILLMVTFNLQITMVSTSLHKLWSITFSMMDSLIFSTINLASYFLLSSRSAAAGGMYEKNTK